jgi:uncharacterized protein
VASHAVFFAPALLLLCYAAILQIARVVFGGGALALHLSGLAAVIIATSIIALLFDRDRWYAVAIGRGRFTRAVGTGSVTAVSVVVAAHLLILALSQSRIEWLGAIGWSDLLLLFVAVALHEELLYRGYFFGKLAESSRVFAVVTTSLVFVAMHLGNPGVSAIAITNLFLGGAVLGLLVLLTRSIWSAVAFHYLWNVVSGLVLGHRVSGYGPEAALYRFSPAGADFVTGGDFGVEASILTTFLLSATALVLALAARRRQDALVHDARSRARIIHEGSSRER